MLCVCVYVQCGVYAHTKPKWTFSLTAAEYTVAAVENDRTG